MVDIEKLHEALRNGVLKQNSTPFPALPQQTAPVPTSGFFASLGLPSDYARETGKSVSSLQEEPSWISKFFDTLSAPLYGVYDTAENVADLAQGETNFGEFLKETGKTIVGTTGRIASGIDDTLIPGIGPIPDDIVPDSVQDWSEEVVPHRLGSDVLESLGVENKVAKYGGGFLMDVLADPLTYVGGVGLIGKGKNAKDAVKAVSPGSDPSLFTKPAEPPSVQEVGRAAKSEVDSASPFSTTPRNISPGRAREGYMGAGVTDEAGNLTPVAKEALERDILAEAQPALQAFRNNANRKKGDYYPDAERANWVPLSEHKAAKAGKIAESGPKGLKLYHETLRRMVTDINANVMPGPVIAKTPVAPATGILRDEAESILQTWSKEISVKASAKGHTELNPANQANIWNRIMNRVQQGMRNPEEAGLFTTKLMKDGTAYIKGSKAEQFNAGLSMLRAAEDAAIASGNVPQYWNGTRLRLSDLLHEIGPEGYKEHGTALIDAFKERDFSKISNPFVQAKIAELSARTAVKDSWIVDTARNYTERALSDLFDNLPPVQANAMVNNLPSEIEDMVKAAGLAKKEAAAVRDVARGVIGVNRDPLDNVLYNFGQALQKSKIDGKLDPKVVSAMNHKIQDIMKITPTDVSVRGKTHGVIGEIMLRMTTWWGRGEMKKFADNAFIAGELRAKARAEGIGNLLRNYSQQELQNAMRVAQGIFPAAGRTEKELEASRIIRDYFETVIGSSRLRDYKDYAGVTSFRSGATMADVNQALSDLGSYFQFTTKPYKHPATGVKRNEFKETVDWTTSWEALDPSKLGYKNPAHLLYDIDLAMERVTNEYAMVDTFVNNFGARRTDRHFNPARHTTPLAHSRGGDYYFEKETVQQFNRLLKDIHDGLWKPNQPLVKHYARGLSSWKRGVTIYMPSHHVRNMIGDLHMTWWAGHNDPRDFIRARRVLGASRAQYKEVIQSGNIQEINKLIDPEAAAWNSTNATDVILRQGKHSLNAGEIYKAAFDRGLLLRAQQLEDLFGDSVQEAMAGGTGLRRFLKQPLGGKAHDTASNLSEYRDHYVRLHHFIAAINKEMKKGKKSKRDLDFNKIFDDAANEVRKWHPDGRDLTQFEQKARLAIPFYSWTRKALPLMVQSAVQKPAKITYAPKAVAALQGVAGIETDNPILDPFPDDQLFPEWIRASGIGPIGAAHSDNPWTSFWGRLGRNLTNPFGEYGYTVINPGNPFIDTAEQHVGSGSFHDLLSGVMGMTTPAFQIPSNLYANETGIGRPIMGDEPGAMGLSQYAVEQVPILAPLQNVLEVGRDQKPDIDNTFDYQALMNYLTAAGITGTSPYIKSAEFEVKG